MVTPYAGVWIETWDMESPEDAVIKEFDHCMDSDRYYCYTFLRRRLRWKY